MKRTRLTLVLAILALICVQVVDLSASPNNNANLEITENGFRYKENDTVTAPKKESTGSSKGETIQQKAKREKAERDKFYKYFEGFVKDSLHFVIRDASKYKTRDEEIQDYLNAFHFGIDSINIRLKALEDYNKILAERGGNGSTESWVRILLFVLAFVLFVFLLVLIWLIKGLEDEIVSVVTDNNGEVKKWVKRITEKPSITPVSKSYDSEIRDLQKENRELKNRINELEDNIRALKNKPEARVIEQQTISSKPVDSIKLLYSDSIIDGWFCHVWTQENDDTIFVLKLKSESHAIFTIFNQAYNKVLANASYLDGCDKQVLNCNTVDILSEGEAVREANGKWKVVSPLKVELR